MRSCHASEFAQSLWIAVAACDSEAKVNCLVEHGISLVQHVKSIFYPIEGDLVFEFDNEVAWCLLISTVSTVVVE